MPTRQFRYWGSKQPPTERAAIKAEVTTTDAGDGVATIRLYDPVDSWGGFWGVSASEFAVALDELPSNVDEIRLRINSPGGDVFEGVAIMNLLAEHPAKLVAVVDGIAASAASFIACSADEVVMGRSAQLMIHDAWGIAIGNASVMKDMAAQLGRISDSIAEVYAGKAGGTVADWRSAMLAESWYTGAEAVDAGLADRVVEPPKREDDDQADQARNRFDLSVFAHRGRTDAPPPPMPAVEPATEPPSAAAAGSPAGLLLAAAAALDADLAVAVA